MESVIAQAFLGEELVTIDVAILLIGWLPELAQSHHQTLCLNSVGRPVNVGSKVVYITFRY